MTSIDSKLKTISDFSQKKAKADEEEDYEQQTRYPQNVPEMEHEH